MLNTSFIFKRFYSQTSSLNITENAMKQLYKINQREATKQVLRIQVDSGGCHGYQYKIELSNQIEPDDIILEKNGEKFVVDPMSLDFLRGSTLDYVQELIGSSFQIVSNPNAESSCGCKTSFNLKI